MFRVKFQLSDWEQWAPRSLGRLLQPGYRVTVWNRTSAKADQLVSDGAVLAQSPAAALAPGRYAAHAPLRHSNESACYW